MENELLFDVQDGVATITINRPEKRNSFTDEMVGQWVAWLEDCKSRDDIKTIVFTGTGSSFSSGGDTSGFKEKANQTPLDAKDRMMANTQSLARKMAEIDKPVIAAVKRRRRRRRDGYCADVRRPPSHRICAVRRNLRKDGFGARRRRGLFPATDQLEPRRRWTCFGRLGG